MAWRSPRTASGWYRRGGAGPSSGAGRPAGHRTPGPPGPWNAPAGSLNRCALFTPDGAWVITGDWGGTVRVWDVATGALRARFHELGGVDAVAFAPATRTLAVGAYRKTISLFDLTLEKPTAKESE